MKKKFAPVFFAVMLAGISAHAQQAEKFNPQKDKKMISGYTIQLIPSPGNTFGFAIMKDKKPIWSQPFNPFMHAPIGFKNKENAYKVAEWVVTEGIKDGRSQHPISPLVAKQLDLPTELLNSSPSPIKK